jgi:hypothetical protein
MTSTGTTNKPFRIEKRQVYEAYKAVKSNRGAAGVDGQTVEMFPHLPGGTAHGAQPRDLSAGTHGRGAH